MVTITVGYIAGIIAAAIFVSRIWVPMVLTFILSAILKDKNTAATWTLASRAFERTNWPDVLRSDSAKNHGVRRSVVFLTNLVSFMALLIAIAGIVTPLGIYQTLAPAKNIQTPFKYLLDNSPFGIGTPARSNLGFNRICVAAVEDLAAVTVPIPCPFTNTVDIESSNGIVFNSSFPYGYDISIPQILLDTYSSGVGNDTTISNFFDIQWRQYMTTTDPNRNYNNGSSYLVEAFRGMQTLGLNNDIEVVAGLIVDMVSGGIGFRNHTAPPGFQFGVTWEEDILFIEPETVCVDTNTTIDYKIGSIINGTEFPILDLVLTDRGGFVNINRTYPVANLSNPQQNQDLWTRAYKAAWDTNFLSMLWYNVTNPNNVTTGREAFSYMNSFMNKTFPLIELGITDSYTSLSMDETFNTHLNLGSDGPGNPLDPTAGGLPNPFSITSENFTAIGMICSGAGDGDYANITNILVRCGLMTGVPQRQDPGSNLIFQPESLWSQPLYSCATAVRTSIKTVSFVFNGTYELENLKVASIQPKNYSDANSLPLWGLENTGNAYTTSGISLIWGLVSDNYENNPNVSTVRQENLYLPGYFDLFENSPFTAIGTQNLPASDFYGKAVDSAYTVGDVEGTSVIYDYSGGNNMALWAKWQTLSANTTAAALIPNLIFTDYAAAAVVGTKGVLGPGNAATQNMVALTVTPTVSKIKYRWPFAIPALLAAFGLLLFTALAGFTMLCRRHNISRLRVHLNQLSPGRIFTTFLFSEPGVKNLNAEDWNKRFGKQMVDLSGEHHSDADNGIVPEKQSAAIDSQTVSDEHSGEGQGFLGENGHTGEADMGGEGFAK